ncbi:MAG: PspC domain-containing protein [Bacteroidia bacterium]|nr:PspC domain-containing protein [Bacteroidia bacterium]
MNKTITINISGINFHIDEGAYESLSKYLATIRGYFSSSDGRDEIMADIESRIAELLQEKISVSKQVVTMEDIEHVVGIMGKPEDYGGDEAQAAQEEKKAETNINNGGRVRRRLFRDPDSRVMGGVCNGIAHYLNWDVVWVRIIFIALIWAGGAGFFAYIILWIVVPDARTTAEKLQMRGESVDVNTISKSVIEEAGLPRKKVRDGAGSGTSFWRVLGNVVLRCLGLFLVGLATFLLIMFVLGLFGFSVANGSAGAGEYLNGVFDDPTQKVLLYLGAILAFGIPIIMLLYVGIKLLFKLKYRNKWINIAAGLLLVIGIAICVSVTLRTVAGFSEYAEVKNRQFPSQPNTDTLFIGMNMADKYNAENFFYEESNENGRVTIDGDMIIKEADRKIFISTVRVHIIPNHLDTLEVLVISSAHGPDKENAKGNARKIVYNYSLKDSAILLNNYFSVGANDKWKNQSVDVYIKVPKNKVIYLDRSVEHAIYDVKNTTNTDDKDMVARKWKMTPVGLECIDCKDLEEKENFEDRLKRKIEKKIELKLEEQMDKIEKEVDDIHDGN